MMSSYLISIKKQFLYSRSIGEKAIQQLADDQLNWQCNSECNSISMIVNHITGNMLSRFTDFLTSDGEKPWRDREHEFVEVKETRELVLTKWEKGWNCLLGAIENLTIDDLEKIVYIRNEGHTVTEAINRQLAHYSYHIGQIVFIAKMLAGEQWQSLSISKGQSKQYNDAKFAQQKQKRHFTDGV